MNTTDAIHNPNEFDNLGRPFRTFWSLPRDTRFCDDVTMCSFVKIGLFTASVYDAEEVREFFPPWMKVSVISFPSWKKET